MFFGETAINLDVKGRLAIPMRYRDMIQEQSGGQLVLTYSAFDSGALYLYPEQEWERVRDEVTGLSTFNPAHRSLQRKLVGSASAVEPDANGRIQLPQTLRQVAGLEKRSCCWEWATASRSGTRPFSTRGEWKKNAVLTKLHQKKWPAWCCEAG